jgi:hypothetical protein
VETKNKNVSVTDLIHGPFAVVVTDPQHPDDDQYPMVVSPLGGYATKEKALELVESFANTKVPYLGLHFHVTQLSSPSSFVAFCSWED